MTDDSNELQLRLCFISHTGSSGSRGAKSTESTLRQIYFWSTVMDDIRKFVRSCMHCLPTSGGKRVLRLLGLRVHGTGHNARMKFDYIEISSSELDGKYVIIMRDDHSEHKYIYPFPDISDNAEVYFYRER